MTDNRPAAPSLAPRTKIRAAPDENVDPIDAVPQAAVPPEPRIAAPVEAPIQEVRVPEPAPKAAMPTYDDAELPIRTAPPARRMRAEVTVQLTSRVSEQTRDFLDDIVAREGGTVRRAIERAIATYANGQR